MQNWAKELNRNPVNRYLKNECKFNDMYQPIGVYFYTWRFESSEKIK